MTRILAAAALVAASVTPTAAASVDHDPTSAALLPALEIWGGQPRIGARERSEVVITSPRDVTGDSLTSRQYSGRPASADGASVAADRAAAGWWDGTATLADGVPQITEQAPCALSDGDGSLALFAGGPLSAACASGGLAGSVRGVGWFEGYGGEGAYVGVKLVGVAGLVAERYRGLGLLDVVFDGGTLAADFTQCEHRAGPGYSSCLAVVAGASLPPGALVGVAAPGTEALPRSAPSSGASGASDATAVTPASERAALLALYNATGGAGWTRNTNWNTTAPVRDWYGVTTDSGGHVVSLYLYNNALSGQVPAQIGDLANLTWLDLNFNDLSGAIPARLWDLTGLTRLNLGNNELSGSLPAAVGGLTSLTYLHLGGNELSGPVPSAIGDLSALVSLLVFSNEFEAGKRLSGPIPAQIGNLTNLRLLDLNGNGLSGPIPAQIGNLTSLTSLYLNRNSLSGPIPAQIGNLTNLRRLVLSANGLSGPIPAQIASLTRLTHLDLVSNSLTGEIPSQIASLTSLTDLDLFDNSLSGPVPAQIGSLTGLHNLRLAGNQLTGAIPSQLGNLTSLQRLNLGSNRLTGPIPGQLADLESLASLSLGPNRLTGTIPSWLGDLDALTFLDLGSNQLTGPIPAALAELASLDTLYLDTNSLSGPIPSWLGNLTRLGRLLLHDNDLTGPIPAELANLTNLSQLWLHNNRLWGPVPAELGRIGRLQLWLYGNELSGCVPDEISSLGDIRFDAGMAYCASSTVSVSAARTSEADGAALFTVSITPPADAVSSTDSSEVRLDYATQRCCHAGEGADYTTTSGTLTIPAGARYGTVSVPVVDDGITERAENFALSLSNPVGAALAGTRAQGWIQDSAGSAVPRTACGGAVVRGGIAGVFDVAQAGYARWHHVFVDVNVSCGADLVSAVGYPTAVEVIAGPSGSIGASRYCVTGTGITPTTASVPTAAGCRTSASPSPAKFTSDGRSTHIVEIPDTAVGSDHQLLAWVDLDVDGVFDAGEPYDIFASDFSSREADDSGLYDYRYPRDFEVRLLGGSTRVGRAGHDTELRLRLVSSFQRTAAGHVGLPVTETVYRPVANAPVGAFVSIGPSHGAHVMCLVTPTAATPSPNAANTCLTDPDGVLIVRYRVPTSAMHLLRQQRDVVHVYLDYDRDGTHDHHPGQHGHEPSDTIGIRIAKAANYIALGDSYSSGEAGATPPQGAYQAGVSHADAECRRWDKAYPHIFADEVLGRSQLSIDATFATYACTGATTHNIHDPADPSPTPSPGVAHTTDRPSPAAARGAPVHDPSAPPAGGQQPVLHERDPRWEPRQAVSLKDVHDMRAVDMITLTVGGNDAGFADTIKRCASIGCGEVEQDVFDEVRERLTAVLLHLKSAAPNASVFVLGYPAVTPTFEGCSAASAEHIETFERTGLSPAFVSLGLSSKCVHAVREYVDWLRGCRALDGGEALHALTGIGGIVTDGLAVLFAENLRVDAAEAAHLRNAADGLNDAVRRAAETAGTHFVDVLGEAAPSGQEVSFWDHSPCHDDPWVNGVVIDDTRFPAISNFSFHPNTEGQHRYAEILEQYVRVAVAGDAATLTEAGLPVNPPRQRPTGHGARSASAAEEAKTARSSASVARQSGDPSGGADTANDPDSANAAEATAGYLVAERVAAVSGCGSPFVSPGEQVKLVAGGFAAGASVSFTARAASLGGTVLAAPTLTAVTADADGAVEVFWTVPGAPAVGVDAAPRAYLVEASGLGAGGGAHTAYMIEPLVAYPGAPVCAVDDAAATTLGEAVSVAVLSNDVAPAGGTLDASSVEVRGGSAGSVSVDAATGEVTFRPDAGFNGTAVLSYVVYDSWRIGVRADITVTVSAGCTVTGTAGTVGIVGTDGDDVICVPDPADRRAFHVIDAKAGDDTIIGGAGVEWIYAGSGTDTIYGRGGDDRIVAGAGADTVYGGAGFDRIYSADLVDTVIDDPDGSEVIITPAVTVPSAGPAARSDWLYADVAQRVIIDVLGNDHDSDEDLDPATLRIIREPVSGAARVVTVPGIGPAIEYVAAAGGSDSLAYEICDALGACDIAEAAITVGVTGCTIVGTGGDDTLAGTPGDDVICGLGGDDVIFGLGGDDTIIGGPGDDMLYGGDQTLIGAVDGDDVVWGGAGDDTLYGGNGADVLYGAAGDDTLFGNRRDDRIHGGPGDDTAVGGGEDDLIFGGPGDDTLDGHADDDTLWGGPGDDTLRGGNGDDTIWGGEGDDTLSGWAGADALHGGPGDDTLDGNTQNDSIWGGPGDDTLRGQRHDDTLRGGPGDDSLVGGDGTDRLYGDSGHDTLDGGAGADYLNGGADTDTCTRGPTTAACETRGRP